MKVKRCGNCVICLFRQYLSLANGRSDFRQKVQQAGLESTIQVFSAATSHWEVGSQPHKGTRKILEQQEFPIKECGRHKSSQVILKNMTISLGWIRIMWPI